MDPDQAGRRSVTYSSGPSSDPKTWEILRQSLEIQPSGLVFVLEGTGPSLSSSLRALAGREPVLELDLPIRVLQASHPLAKVLRARQGWGPEARWAYFDSEARLKAGGTALPSTPVELAGRFLGAGYRSPIQVLEAFLQGEPQRLDVRARLLEARLQLAFIRLQAGHQGKQAPLPEAEDLRLFGPFVRELRAYLADPGWPRQIPFFLRNPEPLGSTSPLLRKAARQALPQVEQVLRQAPEAHELWELWGHLILWGEGDATALAQKVHPLLGRSLSPNAFLVHILRNEALRKGDWKPLRDFLLPYQHLEGRELADLSQATTSEPVAPLEPEWYGQFGPLVEACLRTGHASEADRVVREVVAWSGLPEAALWAAQAARKAGAETQARAWALLGAQKPTPLSPAARRTRDLEGKLRAPRLHDLLFFLDDGKGYAERMWELCREPDLARRGLACETLSGEVAATLRAREGWDGRGRWVLVNPEGRIKASGTESTAPALAKALEEAGLRQAPEHSHLWPQ